MQEITEAKVLSAIMELKDDPTVPRNVKVRLSAAEAELRKRDDYSVRVNKALNELEDVSDDTNIQAYTRTQLWNIVSMLEKLQ
ncbi:MAG: UPF0147 family protein [Nanoarchaeota archaeon]